MYRSFHPIQIQSFNKTTHIRKKYYHLTNQITHMFISNLIHLNRDEGQPDARHWALIVLYFPRNRIPRHP